MEKRLFEFVDGPHDGKSVDLPLTCKSYAWPDGNTGDCDRYERRGEKFFYVGIIEMPEEFRTIFKRVWGKK